MSWGPVGPKKPVCSSDYNLLNPIMTGIRQTTFWTDRHNRQLGKALVVVAGKMMEAKIAPTAPCKVALVSVKRMQAHGLVQGLTAQPGECCDRVPVAPDLVSTSLQKSWPTSWP